MSLYSRLLEILLPEGGTVVHMVEAYFDESGTHDGSPVMCIGGFVIDSEDAKSLDADWARMLNEYSLPYFHMTDCANGAEDFAHLSMEERIAAGKDAIALIRKYMINGRMVSLDPRDYELYAPSGPEVGSAYSFCAHGCIAGVQQWADHANYWGDIAYFFGKRVVWAVLMVGCQRYVST